MSGYSETRFVERETVPRQRYVANPVEVDASVIHTVHKVDGGGKWVVKSLFLEDGTEFVPTAEQLARIDPHPGDYVVWQEDGYCYLNPKDVFERKYRRKQV